VPFREAIMRSLVVGVAVVLCVGLAGCKKAMNNDSSESSGQYSGGGNPTGYGAQQAVRGAVNRTVTAAELHDLHLMLNTAKGASGRVPTSQETVGMLNRPDGNPKLREMVNDGTIVLVAAPQEEGLWAYDKNARTQGGWILTHNGAERVTAQDFASRFPGY
jgi:hypothetical protein